jgi:anti-sigma28 factor (negative regulator of flagellin synthesis)
MKIDDVAAHALRGTNARADAATAKGLANEGKNAARGADTVKLSDAARLASAAEPAESSEGTDAARQERIAALRKLHLSGELSRHIDSRKLAEAILEQEHSGS